MRSETRSFDIAQSKDRLDEILIESDSSYEEVSEVPDPARLTYRNGFYFNCSSIFIDIRRSKTLTEKYKRPTLAKIYRCFISEMVAVFSGDSNCREINIQGDCVWCVINTPYKSNIDATINSMAKANSVRKLINKRFARYGIDPIHVGIGASWGRALMIKAGYSGSGINDIVYMGDVVNHASSMCSLGDSAGYNGTQYVTNDFYSNLNDTNVKLFTRKSNPGDISSVYSGDFHWNAYDEWVSQNA
jgi:class 3 adenylate cyclase